MIQILYKTIRGVIGFGHMKVKDNADRSNWVGQVKNPNWTGVDKHTALPINKSDEKIIFVYIHVFHNLLVNA